MNVAYNLIETFARLINMIILLADLELMDDVTVNQSKPQQIKRHVGMPVIE